MFFNIVHIHIYIYIYIRLNNGRYNEYTILYIYVAMHAAMSVDPPTGAMQKTSSEEMQKQYKQAMQKKLFIGDKSDILQP